MEGIGSFVQTLEVEVNGDAAACGNGGSEGLAVVLLEEIVTVLLIERDDNAGSKRIGTVVF